MEIRNLHRESKQSDKEPTKPKQTPQNQNKQNQNRNNNTNNWTQEYWNAEINKARKTKIYSEIMGGIFDIGRYLHTVPQDACVYHGVPHVGGTAACSAMKRMYSKAALLGKNKIPIAQQLRTERPLMPPPPALRPQRAPPTQQQNVRFQNPPPTAHHTSIEEPLEEIDVSELHDTITDFADAPPDDHRATNDTNNESKAYSNCSFYCALNTVSILENPSKSSTIRILVDSGASHTMINNKTLFTTLHLWNNKDKHVTLADGKTLAPIMGSRSIQGTTSRGHIFTLDNCLYVPFLSDSLFATKSTSRQQGFHTHTENSITTIATPTFSFNSDDNPQDNLIFFNLQPLTHTVCNKTEAKKIQTPINITPDQPPLSEIEKENLLHRKSELPHYFRSNSKIMFKRKNDHKFHRGY